jgi:hypothetical protein
MLHIDIIQPVLLVKPCIFFYLQILLEFPAPISRIDTMDPISFISGYAIVAGTEALV